jgi:RND family efflux transporter MFP subunit
MLFLSSVQASEPLATADAQYRVLPREYRLDGSVEAVHQTTVSAQTSGQAQEVLFDVDDYVEKGTLIVRLKDTEQKAGLKAAEAELQEARARLKEASDEYTRNQQLFKKKLVSQSAMDKSGAARKAAQARVDAALAVSARAREQLEYTRVRAPYTGIVTHRHLEVGEVARPGQKLMTGISLDQLRVNVDMPQSLIGSVRKLRKARVQQPDGGWVKVTRITVFPFADFRSHTFKVRLDLPEGIPDMFPGMFVKTAFVTGLKKELVVPAASVVYRSELTGVYVVSPRDRIGFRQVRIGHETDHDQVTVLSGLDAGERVALDPVAAGILLKKQRAEPKDD